MAVNKVLALAVFCSVFAGVHGRALLQTNSTASSQTVRWFVPANGALEPVTVPVGGSVIFSWTSTHDLWQTPSSSCPSTFTNGSCITQLAAQSNGGSRTVNYTTAGTRYYACSVGNHCSQGQHITVIVGSASPAPAPGPASRYGAGYGGAGNCGGNSTSGSGYGGSSGSGSNYAGAPGVSAYGGGASSSSNSTGNSTTTRSGAASYGGGGAGYAGGSSENYGR